MATNRRNSEERRNSIGFTGPALDEIIKEVKTVKGNIKKVPALHAGFVTKKTFLAYTPPPLWTASDHNGKGHPSRYKVAAEFANAAIEEWLCSTYSIIKNLKWLLQLPHSKFWSQVTYDDSVHKTLQSYLCNAPRCYDLYNPMEDQGLHPIWSKVKEDWLKIHDLVFKIFVRMSTYKESKNAHINPPVFGDLIYDEYLFDIPTLLDLCVLYGRENQAILNKMVDNVFSIQPKYFDDLNANIMGFIKTLENIEVSLGLSSKSNSENWFELKSPNAREEKAKIALREFKDVKEAVMDVVEISMTIGALIDVFPTISSTFRGHNFEIRIAAFYEKVFPVLEDYLKGIMENEPQNSKMAKLLLNRISMAKVSILKLFRDIIFSTCLQPILDSDSNDNQVNVDNFLQVLCTCLSEKSFICDYEVNFPFEDDVDMICQTKCQVDETRTSFIQNSIRVIMGKSDTNEASPLYFALKKKEQRKFSKAEESASLTEDYSLLGATANPQVQVDGVELESLMSNIQDFFPDIGRGFIRSCLEYYNFESEKVINALLENSLPSCLASLDRNSAVYQPSVRPKQTSSFAKSKPTFTGLLSERKNVFDGDEFDVYSREKVDTSKIHKGKKTGHRDISSLLNDKEDVLAAKEVYKKFEITVTERQDDFEAATDDMFTYDDEYDDTYDDTTTTAWADATAPGDDVAFGKKFTIPRVLRTKEDEEEIDEEDELPTNPNYQDHKIGQQPLKNGNTDTHQSSSSFGAAKFRSNDASEAGGAAGSGGFRKGKDFNKPKKEFTNVQGKPKGQGQDDKTLHARRSKEQHKGAYGNHNRKAQADRKRNRGMIPT